MILMRVGIPEGQAEARVAGEAAVNELAGAA